MKNRGLSSDASFIDCRTGIDVCSAIQKEPRGFDVSVFRRHMQQSRSFEREHASRRGAKVELGESPVYQARLGVEVLPHEIEPAAKQVQYGGYVVLGNAPGLEKDV